MAATDRNLPLFTIQEVVILKRALELLEASYARAQKQRPEFAEIAKREEQSVSQLINKMNGLNLI